LAGRVERVGQIHPVQETVCGNDAVQAQVSEVPGAQEEARQATVDLARNLVGGGWESGVMDEAGPRAAGAQWEWVWEVDAGKEMGMVRDCVRMIQGTET
jgi:hypothetical protein